MNENAQPCRRGKNRTKAGPRCLCARTTRSRSKTGLACQDCNRTESLVAIEWRIIHASRFMFVFPVGTDSALRCRPIFR